VEVPLTRGKTARIDARDAERVLARRWVAQKGGNTWYAMSSDGYGKVVPLHRFITAPPPDKEVDHRDGDGLNNVRANLRVCSHAENLRNSRAQEGTTSRFKGVSRQRDKWRAEIEQDGERLYLGQFETEEAAARQYDRAARIFFGGYARTNQEMGLLPK
jgi:hypothetical protein